MTPRHFWGQLLSRSAVKVRLFAGQALRVTRKNQRWTHYWKQLVVVADQQSQVAARDGFPDESGLPDARCWAWGVSGRTKERRRATPTRDIA
tara:strand:+ start:550 stop:825 length:276 start_codon:yes stop_codon:yes gene_type:complete